MVYNAAASVGLEFETSREEIDDMAATWYWTIQSDPTKRPNLEIH